MSTQTKLLTELVVRWSGIAVHLSDLHVCQVDQDSWSNAAKPQVRGLVHLVPYGGGFVDHPPVVKGR